MNYRHLYHAGNFADVFKHIILVQLLLALQRKDPGFCFLDTHAATGRYNLLSAEAKKNNESKDGIQKIISQSKPLESVQRYLACVKQCSPTYPAIHYYPGSPEIARQLLRPQDRMVLSELNASEYRALKKNIPPTAQITIQQQDAYQSLKAYLPPKERRGLILIDPPYEKSDEYDQIMTGMDMALARFATGIYAIWYPIKDHSPLMRLIHTLKKYQQPMMAAELCIYPENIPTVLNGCGMLIINPPWQFDRAMQQLLPWLWQTLSIDNQGRHTLFEY